MIGFEEALSIVRANRWCPKPLSVPLARANGRRLASAVCAVLDSPPYTNSAMDGFGVGSLEGPWQIIGAAPAGSIGPALAPGHAIRINTGSLVPEGALAVIPQEEAEVQDDQLRAAPVRPGAHIRIKGEEFPSGSPLFSAASKITPPVVAALAAQGLACVIVESMPRVALLSTGAELLTPGEPYIAGRVYDSNSIGISLILEQMGCIVTRQTVTDDAESTFRAIQKLQPDHDLILTIGGVSVGDHDFVRPSVAKHGFEILFSGAAIKPGKPISFGVHGDKTAWFGLPGNPMSALITFCLFVREYLGEPIVFHPLSLADGFSRKPGRVEFVPARLSPETQKLVLNPAVGSHATSGLSAASGLARLPAEISTLAPGELVEYAPFPWSIAA